MNAKTTQVWSCEKCGAHYFTKSSAELCCADNLSPKKVCEDCGVAMDTKSYFTVCDNCREKRRYNRCRKMTIAEYEKEFPDNMVVVGYDDYYSSIQDALEYFYDDEEALPHYVYGTKKIYVTVDIEGAVERALEDAYEDAEFSNVDELYDFVGTWNERNKLAMFEEANIVIDIPEATRQEYMSCE